MSDDDNEKFITEYNWDIPKLPGRNFWSPSEYFTLPNYDKIFFSICVREDFTSDCYFKIIKKGIFNPSQAHIKLQYSGRTMSKKIVDWTSSDSEEFDFGECPQSNEIKCTIVLDKIDLDKTDYQILSSISNYNYAYNYLLSSEYSDVSIKVEDHEDELPAHKFVLASHSSVFRKIFTTDMKGARENRLFLNEFDVDIIIEVLRFMYTGKIQVDGNFNLLLKVLSCAETYQIKNLITFTSYQLIKCLTVDNVVNILEATDKYDVPKLKEKVLLYLHVNKERISFHKAIDAVKKSQVLMNFFRTEMNMKINEVANEGEKKEEDD